MRQKYRPPTQQIDWGSVGTNVMANLLSQSPQIMKYFIDQYQQTNQNEDLLRQRSQFQQDVNAMTTPATPDRTIPPQDYFSSPEGVTRQTQPRFIPGQPSSIDMSGLQARSVGNPFLAQLQAGQLQQAQTNKARFIETPDAGVVSRINDSGTGITPIFENVPRPAQRNAVTIPTGRTKTENGIRMKEVVPADPTNQRPLPGEPTRWEPWTQENDGVNGGRPYVPFVGWNAKGQGVFADARTGKFTDPQDVPGGGGPTVGRQFVELPSDAQKSLTFGFQSMGQLDTMEKGLKYAGRVLGQGKKLEVWLGQGGKEATDYQTAFKNYRLSVQSLIKGIPSNYDVEIALAVIPELGDSPAEAKSKLDYQRRLTTHVIKSVLAYYKGTNKLIPEFIKGQARQRGIDMNTIDAWDGQSDPLTAGMPEYKQGGAKKAVTDEELNAMTDEQLKAYIEGK